MIERYLHPRKLECTCNWKTGTGTRKTRMKSLVRHIVFDMGNVLVEWDPKFLYQRLIPDEHERSWFLQNVCSPAWNVQQDIGRTWHEAEEFLIARFPDFENLIRAFRLHWNEMVPGAIPGSVEIMREFEGTGEVELVGLPPGVTCEKTKMEVKNDTEQVVYTVKIAEGAKVGQHKSLVARARINDPNGLIRQTQGTGTLQIDKPIPAPAEKPATPVAAKPAEPKPAAPVTSGPQGGRVLPKEEVSEEALAFLKSLK